MEVPGRERKSEGEKEDGQRKKREEKRKGERMREIALERIFEFALLQIMFLGNLGIL